VVPNAEGDFSGLIQGDLGKSLWRQKPVTSTLISRLPVSFELGVFAIITALAIALPIGTLSAIRQDTFSDYAGRTVAIMAISLPSFWIATLVIIYASIYLDWSPEMRYVSFFESPGRNLVQFVVPGVILGMVLSGTTMRMMRTMMLEVLRQDYIRTAWAKGLRERSVIMRHALKNALIPVVTLIGNQIAIVISGSIVLETIFALPGVGLLLIDALNTRDYPVISGVNVILATAVLMINLVVDVTYGWLDPRVSYK
jgi:peptide/nickel transport system permease protein